MSEFNKGDRVTISTHAGNGTVLSANHAGNGTVLSANHMGVVVQMDEEPGPRFWRRLYVRAAVDSEEPLKKAPTCARCKGCTQPSRLPSGGMTSGRCPDCHGSGHLSTEPSGNFTYDRVLGTLIDGKTPGQVLWEEIGKTVDTETLARKWLEEHEHYPHDPCYEADLKSLKDLLDDMRPTMSRDEPHKVSEPSTAEEIADSDNRVICENFEKSRSKIMGSVTRADVLPMLLNLLARIHRDGGHHTEEVGLATSVFDADKRVAELNTIDERGFEHQIQALQEENERLRRAIRILVREEELANTL